MRTALLSAIGAGLFACATALADVPRIDPVFMDQMVLQRGKPVTVSGTAGAGDPVTLRLGTRERSVTTDPDGFWRAEFGPFPPSGPFTLTAETAEGTDQRSDILVGDVWLCAGQSNMEFPVSRALNPGLYLEGPFDETVRLLKVTRSSAIEPQASLPDGVSWKPASQESVQDFSALCYFLALEQRTGTDIPIGLIDSSWGGSEIAAWIGRNALGEAGLLADRLALLDTFRTDRAAGLAAFANAWEGWWTRTGAANTQPWTTADEGPWTGLSGPMRDWKNYGDPVLEDHLGMVWFRRTVTLGADEASAINRIDLGAIDEIDTLWINGEMVATGFGWGSARRYSLPVGVLREGENLIVLNVLNGWAEGGLLGPAGDMKLAGSAVEVPLGEGWSYRRVPGETGTPPRAPWFSINGVGGLSNAMIAPLSPYRLRGAIWYQGESDTGQPDAYAPLLDALMSDWRARFNADLPILLVQLPEFGAPQTHPGDSGWAGVREAQRRVAAGDDLVGLVVAMDAGTRFDIHPPDKLTVARRAARTLAAMEAGDQLRADGFAPARLTRVPAGLQLIWPDRAGEALKLMGHDRPVGLEVCGRDGACRYADGTLSGPVLTLPLRPDETATEVRYCWADVPLCNLYRDDWTPVTPFRMAVPGARAD